METTSTTPVKKTKNKPKFYLGWRGNPQLSNGGYYKAYGQLSKADAKKKEKCVYGSMTLESFDTQAEYLAKIDEVSKQGHRVH